MAKEFVVALLDDRHVSGMFGPLTKVEAVAQFDALHRRCALLIRLAGRNFSIEQTHGVAREDFLACAYRHGSLRYALKDRGLLGPTKKDGSNAA